jgi:signal transduction histidine kinase
MLAAVGFVIVLLAVVIADRTAGWVLRPVNAVDRAMAEIGHGRLEARIPPSTGPPELRAIIARFNEMAGRVEHLMRRQQEFVSNASHELRNPLNALMLRVEDLALSAPEENTTEIAHVRAEAVRMAHILDALLLLADDASLGEAAEPLDVADVVARRVQSWRLLAVGKQIELTAADDDTWAVANPIVLECAFDAVMDNAVKFSPPGGRLEVEVTTPGDRVEVTVRDQGPGVPPEELALLTERFWRSPGHSAVKGSGLGLAIASELLATGGGGLRLELPDGGGLRVRLQVPRGDVA